MSGVWSDDIDLPLIIQVKYIILWGVGDCMSGVWSDDIDLPLIV